MYIYIYILRTICLCLHNQIHIILVDMIHFPALLKLPWTVIKSNQWWQWSVATWAGRPGLDHEFMPKRSNARMIPFIPHNQQPFIFHQNDSQIFTAKWTFLNRWFIQSTSCFHTQSTNHLGGLSPAASSATNAMHLPVIWRSRWMVFVSKWSLAYLSSSSCFMPLKHITVIDKP